MLNRRDFIHRMSATLGAAAATYRKVDLLDRARMELPRAATPADTMTWLGDVFPDSGELQQARRLGLERFERGDATAGFDMLLRGVMSHDAPERPYRACLEALGDVSRATGRHRSATTIAWYLASARPDAGSDPRDDARTLAHLGNYAEAARRFEEADFVAHAAEMHAAAKNVGAARALWSRYAELPRRDARGELLETSLHVHRSLAVYNVTRNAGDSALRTRIVDQVMRTLASAVATFDALGHERHATFVSDVLDDITARERMDVPRSVRDAGVVLRTPIVQPPRLTSTEAFVVPLLDLDHGYDPIEICAAPLVEGPATGRRVSPQAELSIRRRALTARLLALEVASPVRPRADQSRLEVALAVRLGQLGDPRLLVAIDALGQSDDESVRAAARHALVEAAGET